MWLLLPVVVGGVAFATVRAATGNPGESDAAPPVAAAKAPRPAHPAAASDAEAAHERKKIRLDPELATALYRVGLQPERLAAAGVGAAVTDDLVVNVKVWLAEHPADLSQADEALFQATKTRDELFRKVRSGLASQEEIEACSNAAAAYNSAAAARTAKLQTIFNEGTRVLTSEQAILLNRLQTNTQAWNIPLEYLVLEKTQEEWVRLRAALANEKISAKYGEDPDGDDQAHLATVRALNEVVTAKVNLDTKLGAITDAWEEAAAAAEGEGQ